MNCSKCSAVMVWKGSLTRGALVCEICEAEKVTGDVIELPDGVTFEDVLDIANGKVKPETVELLSGTELKIGDVVYVADDNKIYPVSHGSNTPTMQEQQDEYMDKIGAYPDDSAEGGYMAKCRGCGNYEPIICAPEDFDPDMQYCGGSPRCCP